MNMNQHLLNGFSIVTVPPRQQRIKRTWKQRLFSLPWEPLRKYDDMFVEMISDGDFLVDNINLIIYCNVKTKISIDDAFRSGCA